MLQELHCVPTPSLTTPSLRLPMCPKGNQAPRLPGKKEGSCGSWKQRLVECPGGLGGLALLGAFGTLGSLLVVFSVDTELQLGSPPSHPYSSNKQTKSNQDGPSTHMHTNTKLTVTLFCRISPQMYP